MQTQHQISKQCWYFCSKIALDSNKRFSMAAAAVVAWSLRFASLVMRPHTRRTYTNNCTHLITLFYRWKLHLCSLHCLFAIQCMCVYVFIAQKRRRIFYHTTHCCCCCCFAHLIDSPPRCSMVRGWVVASPSFLIIFIYIWSPIWNFIFCEYVTVCLQRRRRCSRCLIACV